MSTRIPTSASVSEAAVIEASLSSVWHLIKLQDFSKFWTKLEKSEHVKGTSPETDVVKWTFKDGTILDVKLEEHSVGSSCLLYWLMGFVGMHDRGSVRVWPGDFHLFSTIVFPKMSRLGCNRSPIYIFFANPLLN